MLVIMHCIPLKVTTSPIEYCSTWLGVGNGIVTNVGLQLAEAKSSRQAQMVADDASDLGGGRGRGFATRWRA